jgi:hypothetical protein
LKKAAMPLVSEPVPDGLTLAIEKHYRHKVSSVKSVVIDYRSELRPLWNGTVHIYRLKTRDWPNRLYVFRKPGDPSIPVWVSSPHLTSEVSSPLNAVKAALRKKWAEETEIMP